MANFVNYTQANTIITRIAEKFNALGGAYVPKGSAAFADLPSILDSTHLGYVYNVTNNFTTDARFVEGTGKKYSAGTNVVVVKTGTAGSEVYMFDVIGNFIDLDEIDTKINAIKAMITGTFDEATAYAIGDVVIYENELYSFDVAHAAGTWDSTEVTATTVVDLINAAEPDELTAEQVTALLALLD